MSAFDSPDFKKLQAIWSEKLQEAGFKDIEDKKGNLTDHQNISDFNRRIGFRSDSYIQIRDYYIWATQMANTGIFKSRTDEMIWLMHSEGKSSREISEHVCLAQNTVCLRIKRIREELIDQSEAAPSPF